MWKPYVNQELFTQIENKTWVNNYTGEIVTNPMSVQIISYTFERDKAGIATPKQKEILSKLGIEENQIALYKYEQKISETDDIIKELKTQKKEYSGEKLVEFIDYYPTVTAKSDNDRLYEHIYNNFMESFLDNTNESIFKILQKALNTTGLSKSELGYGISQMPQDILYYIGYGGYQDSQDAIKGFVSDCIQFMPVDDYYKNEIEEELDSLSFTLSGE